VSVNIAHRVMMARQRWNWEQCFIDATGGWAAGARDILIDAGYPVISIQYHAPAPDPRYANMRAYMHWHGAQWVKKGGWLPNDPELPAELTAPTYSYVGGRLLIEPKERIKERLGRSPNKSDALYQTFALPDMPSSLQEAMGAKYRKPAHAADDWDPHRDQDKRNDETLTTARAL